ncbi:MAG: DUF1826 domain-containing protein [Pseudomonadota bacterium]
MTEMTAVVERGEMRAAPTPEGLEAIHAPEVAVSVWRRSLDPSLARWLDAQPGARIPQARFIAPVSAMPEALGSALDDLPAGPERDALAADMADLAQRFAGIAVASQVRVRIDAVKDDACRKFHQDSVALRLLCTYRGPATEWGYAEPRQAPEAIRSMNRGEVSIWKGSKWKGGPGHNMVHRSPPIAGAGVVRLLLVVDQADPVMDGL